MLVAEERRMSKSDAAEMMIGKEDACGSRPIDFAPECSITFTNISHNTGKYRFCQYKLHVFLYFHPNFFDTLQYLSSTPLHRRCIHTALVRIPFCRRVEAYTSFAQPGYQLVHPSPALQERQGRLLFRLPNKAFCNPV